MFPRFLLVTLITLAALSANASSLKTQANVPVEIAFTARQDHADPFNDVNLDVIFTDPAGKEYRVPAFWDGGDVWKVRYASPLLGIHSFRTQCSDTQDSGLNSIQGTVSVERYAGKNDLYKHGPVRVAADNRHLAYADGKPFFWLGDTWWMGLAKRLEWPNEFQALAMDRVEKGFTVVQIVAGLYPDMPPFDPRGANEAGFPWEAEYRTINPAYFDRADERIRYLVDQGISPCIVGAWGYFMPWMGVEKIERHWRYLIARYGAMPVVWCGAGEANLPWYLAPKFPYDDREVVHKWTEVFRYIRHTDPFHRMLTVHPTAIKFYTGRHATDDTSLLDFDMLQTPHGQAGAAEVTLKAIRESYAASPQMPVIDGEAAYEMLNNSIPARWTRAMFWICMMNGAAGHTYGANGIWQNNRPGDPHGKSPHGGSYGNIPSQEAMHLPGSSQVGYGKKLLEKYPWERLQPHPEWVSYPEQPHVTLEGSHWIWYPEGNPAIDAPIATRYFRVAVNVPLNHRILDAQLTFSADNAAVAYVNGERVGESKDWETGSVIENLAGHFRTGENILAFQASNEASNVTQNPAGLIAALEIKLEDGTIQTVHSDGSWKASVVGPTGWNQTKFQDLDWPSAMVTASYGSGPWGVVGAQGSNIAPQATGVTRGVRLFYVLEPRPIVVHMLGSVSRWSAKLFDPVSGKTTGLGLTKADTSGNWVGHPPKGWDHDWVLVLEPYVTPISPVLRPHRPFGHRR